MKKHITYIVLALLLAICLAPATVMADGENTYFETNSIDLGIKPVLGNKVLGDPASGIDGTVHVKSVTCDPTVDSTNRYLFTESARWYKVLNADYTGDIINDTKVEITDTNEVFQDGYHYFAIVNLQSYEKEGGTIKGQLPFKDAVVGKINGNVASYELNNDGYDLLIAGYVDVLSIHKIDMTITAPSLGTEADCNEPTFTVTDNVCEDYYGLGVISIDTIWYKVNQDSYDGIDDSNWVKMEDGEVYATGYYYMAKFEVLVSNKNDEYNFEYLYRTISKSLTGSVNEEDFDKVNVEDDQYHAQLYKCYDSFIEKKVEPTPAPVDDYTPPETGVYGLEETTQSNNFLWLTLLFVGGGAVVVTTLANKKKKYNR